MNDIQSLSLISFQFILLLGISSPLVQRLLFSHNTIVLLRQSVLHRDTLSFRGEASLKTRIPKCQCCIKSIVGKCPCKRSPALMQKEIVFPFFRSDERQRVRTASVCPVKCNHSFNRQLFVKHYKSLNWEQLQFSKIKIKLRILIVIML